MEFLSLSCRRSSARNVPSYEERGETDVFAGYTIFVSLFAPFLQGGAVPLTLKAYSVHCWLGHVNLVSLFQLRLILKPKMPFTTEQFINSVDFCATFLCVIFCKVVLCCQY